MAHYLQDFRILNPKYRCSQQDSLEWLARAHARSRWQELANEGNVASVDALEAEMRANFERYGCGPDRIEERASECGDFMHTRWDRMELFRIHERPDGVGLTERMAAFARATENAFDSFYSEETRIPDHLIHVSCTGYVAPGAAQLTVQKKNWHWKTSIANAYHMGCYAAVPATRMAQGWATSPNSRIDIVHTELCTFHIDPSRHDSSQYVVQSLFADGFIRYSLVCEPNPRLGAAFEVLTLHDELVPESEDEMTWNLSPSGFRMTLAREVPLKLAHALPGFLDRMLGRAFGSEACQWEDLRFAIHPGGPKIIDSLQKFMGLSDEQVAASRRVLRRHGNMSSATLPHVWADILADDSVPRGSSIVSLAFGPGLTIAGGVFRKR